MSETANERVGLEIRRRRKARKLSSRAAAELAGLSRTTWCRMEAGEQITLANLEAAAKALGCKPALLLG